VQRKPATQSFSGSKLSIGPNPDADRNQRAHRLSRRLSLQHVARSPPMKPQRRHTLLLLTFWEAAVIRSARAATKTFPTAQIPPTGEGAAPGLGETLDAAPHAIACGRFSKGQ
jgi:hypothetical protein